MENVLKPESASGRRDRRSSEIVLTLKLISSWASSIYPDYIGIFARSEEVFYTVELKKEVVKIECNVTF